MARVHVVSMMFMNRTITHNVVQNLHEHGYAPKKKDISRYKAVQDEKQQKYS